MGTYIIMLKHEVMAADEWQDKDLGLVMVALCIQILIDKMQL
jgi:hypothetical protein